MNERIRELAEQANFTEQDIENMSPGFEKFAELIVRECAKTAEQHIDERCDRDFGVGVRIREHFGVEQ